MIDTINPQYVQIKNVLKQKFDEFNGLNNDPNCSENVAFGVNLPSLQFKDYDKSKTDPVKIASNNIKQEVLFVEKYKYCQVIFQINYCIQE